MPHKRLNIAAGTKALLAAKTLGMWYLAYELGSIRL